MTAILEKLTLYWAYPFVRYALVVGGLFFLFGRILGAVGYMLCIFALTAVLCALLLSWIRKKGTEIFATL